MNIALALCGSVLNIGLLTLVFTFALALAAFERSSQLPSWLERLVAHGVTALYICMMALPFVSTALFWWLAASGMAIKEFWWGLVPDGLILLIAFVILLVLTAASPSASEINKQSH